MSFTLRFLPEDRHWRSDESVDAAFAAASCGIAIEMPCGPRTSCGKCRVQVLEGAAPPGEMDLRLLGSEAVAQGWRLACRLQLDRSATIDIPGTSRSVAAKSFGDDALCAAGVDPVLRHQKGYGFAVDVGSTTLAAALVALDSGKVIVSASALNPQVRYGSDIMSRIAHAQVNARGTQELHEILIEALNGLFRQCADAAGVDVHQVRDSAFVGNPTMLHTLRCIDLTPLGQAPFDSIRSSWQGAATALDLDLGENARAYIAPAVRCHVGADTVAAIVATGLDRTREPALLIDVGTNSEVVLATAGGIFCTSTSAGPAFEGAHIFQGMRGTSGAIEEVRIRANGSVHVRVIANEPARGLCGSGLVDAVAELLRVGLVDASGRMRSGSDSDGSVSPELLDRIEHLAGTGRAFRLTSPTHSPVYVTAGDVRQLQLVKASIAAAASLLLDHAGLQAQDLDAVLLAGGFGNYLRKDSALTIGLVPAVDPERVRFVGNAAGVGARLLLVDRQARERAEMVAGSVHYLELAGLAPYAMAFIDEMAFPKVEVYA